MATQAPMAHLDSALESLSELSMGSPAESSQRADARRADRAYPQPALEGRPSIRRVGVRELPWGGGATPAEEIDPTLSFPDDRPAIRAGTEEERPLSTRAQPSGLWRFIQNHAWNCIKH